VKHCTTPTARRALHPLLEFPVADEAAVRLLGTHHDRPRLPFSAPHQQENEETSQKKRDTDAEEQPKVCQRKIAIGREYARDCKRSK